MVDRNARDALAESLRHLASGSITNDEFERQVPRHSVDPAVSSIVDASWFLYSDLSTYRLRGHNRLPSASRRRVARAILFLKSELPYEWSYPNPTVLVRVLYLLANIGTLGAIAALQARRWRAQPNSEIWPFFNSSDYHRSLELPPFLRGERPNSAVNADVPRTCDLLASRGGGTPVT
jgi:hypothetical protein